MRRARRTVVSVHEADERRLRASASVIARLVVLALVVSSCALVRANGGIDETRPERFRFEIVDPGPADRVQAERRLTDLLDNRPPGASAERLVDGSLEVVGVIPGPESRYLIEFQIADGDNGLSRCEGDVSESGAGWSCSSAGEPLNQFDGVVMNMGGGGTDVWTEATFLVRDDVDRLVATADDGTRYVMTPRAGRAWIEWRNARGDLTIEALDADGEVIGTEVADTVGRFP